MSLSYKYTENDIENVKINLNPESAAKITSKNIFIR
jgi:hypothetical protein